MTNFTNDAIQSVWNKVGQCFVAFVLWLLVVDF